jgi:hypothetical protein
MGNGGHELIQEPEKTPSKETIRSRLQGCMEVTKVKWRWREWSSMCRGREAGPLGRRLKKLSVAGTVVGTEGQ